MDADINKEKESVEYENYVTPNIEMLIHITLK